MITSSDQDQRLPHGAFALVLTLLIAVTAHCFYRIGLRVGRRHEQP